MKISNEKKEKIYEHLESLWIYLNQNEDEIFGIIAKNDEYDSVCKQKDAWIAQIRLLKNALSKYDDGSVIFEYTIPRVGGRIDNVVLLNDTIFVLEFIGHKWLIFIDSILIFDVLCCVSLCYLVLCCSFDIVL